MSGSNVAHVASVDKGLKMKIKRTKGPNKVDSKHVVVNNDMLFKPPTSGHSMASMAAANMLSSSTASSSPVISTSTTSCGVGNSTSFIIEPSAPSLSLPTSSPAILSLSSNNISSSLVTVANPTVALLKAVTAGIVSEVYSSSNNSSSSSAAAAAVTSKSPLKLNSSGTQVCDTMKDGKSPKPKAAYNKKAKDTKEKMDTLSACTASTSHIPNMENKASLCLVGTSQSLNASSLTFPSHVGVNSAVTSEPRPGDTVHVKRENPVHDPYEFNAKVEDKIELPPKKLKLEKGECIETAISPQPPQPLSSPVMLQPPPPPPKQQTQKRSIGVDVRSVGVVTEPDALGPCEPGTLVGLEGIVWKETDNGLLVVNVTWRGKTYVGTLMDATRYAWAPPRPNGCESPVSDFESRTPKGRGKRNCRSSVQSNERLPEGRRLRKGRRGTVNSNSSNFTAPPSPAKSDVSTSNMKRKTKTNDVDNDKPKRSRSCSRGVTGAESPTPDGYIVCPEPNCHKKYKHMNGLRYHRTHAHRKSSLTDDAKDDDDDDEEDEEKTEKKDKATNSDRIDRLKTKDKPKVKEQQKLTGRDSKNSVDDDVPLKEIANKVSGQTIKVDGISSSKDTIEDESCSSNDGSVITTCGKAKVEPQVLLTKTDISTQNEPVSPTLNCASTLKKKEPNSLDISVTPSASVPCMQPGDSPTTVSGDSGNISQPTATIVRQQVCSVPASSSTAAVLQICPKLSVTSAQTLPPSPVGGVANTTSTSVLSMTLTSDRQTVGKSSVFLKSTSSARLIVPTPHQISVNPQLHNPSSMPTIQQNHGSALKPIQPKPTVMGDLSSVNSSLSDLTKERSRKLKKKKDILETAAQSSSTSCPKGQGSSRETNHAQLDTPSQDDLYKCERAAVIKNSNPSINYESSSPINDLSKLSFQTSLNPHKMQISPSSETYLTSGSRVSIPPSSLSVSSSSIVDNTSTINDDVHSPAYSDISDANDSSSPVQQDSPKKHSSLKKDGHLNGPSHLGPDNSSIPHHQFRNIFYYGGPHYVPHGINPQMSSPTLSDGLIKKEDMEEKRPSGTNENILENKDGARCAQETDLQQKSLMNYLAHLHGVSPATVQLQYNLAGYAPSTNMESSYANLTQQALDQQKRLMQHHEIKGEEGSGKLTPSSTSSTNRSVRHGFEPNLKVVADVVEGQQEQKRLSGDRDFLMKDKQGDMHHNMKENVEMKSQMGHHDQQNYHVLKQQHNDLIRAQMYQQQRQKMFESQRQDKRKSPPELTSTGQQHPSGVISGNQQEIKPVELIPLSMIKKENVHLHKSPLMDIVDSTKRYEGKDEHIKSGQSSLDLTSICRSSSQSNIPQSSCTASSSPATAQSPLLSVPIVGSIPSTATGFAYTPYYPPFRPVQLDYRALSPHIIGYTSGPQAFIHQTQLGYRTPIVDSDGKSPDAVESLRGDSTRLVNTPGYGSIHKIHELHDKSRPSSGVPSPAPGKSGCGENLNTSGSKTPGPNGDKVKDKQREYTSSPPTQRHVHTHHHTHVMSGFPPLYTPDAYTMFGHPAAAAAAATIQTASHPFPAPPPQPAPKS